MDYIRSILSFLFAIFMLYTFLDCDLQKSRKLYFSASLAAVFLMIDIVVLYNFGYVHFMMLYPLLVHFPVLIIFILLSKFSAIKVFFINSTVIAIVTSFSMLALIISSFWDYDKTMLNLICYTLYLPVGFLLYRYVRPAFLYMLRNTNEGWLGFCAIPLSFTAITYFLGKYNLDKVLADMSGVISELILTYAAAALILVIASYALILRHFRQTREKITMESESDILRMQVNSARTHIDALKESQETAAIYRHDMRHHLNLINSFLLDDNKVAAQNYISQVRQNIEDSVVETYCSNYAVNLILNSWFTKAKEEGISVETRIDVPQKNKVSDMGLCIIFSNAIENALQACRRIPYTSERFIKVTCRSQNDQLFIQIINNYAEAVTFVDGLPISSEEEHGLGTRSIAAVVQGYDGLSSFKAENGIFEVSLIL